MTTTTAKKIWTSGDIARELGAKVTRVRHILATRDIPFVGRAGLARLYTEQAMNDVAAELDDSETTGISE